MAGLLAACSDPSKGAGGGGPGQGAPSAPQVPVAQVIVRDIAPAAEFSGALAAPKSVELRPRVSGQIVAVSVPEGAMVAKGQSLFRIDPRPFQVALDTAQAQLAQAQALALQSQSEFERAERLVSTGAVSRKQYEDALSQNRARQAAVQAARAAVSAAQLHLSFTNVTAPISGRVDRVLVTEGNVVSGGSSAATPLTTILSVNPLHVLFDIDETTYLGFAERARKSGGGAGRLPVDIGLMTDKGYPYRATLDFLGNGVDRSSGTIRARAVVDNAGGQLTPGLFARVRLVAGTPQPTVLIEDLAVGNDQGRSYVLVVGAGNKTDYRPIELGPIVDGLRVVKSGLKPGESIVLKGLVRPGMVVAPRRTTMGAPAAGPAGQPASSEASR